MDPPDSGRRRPMNQQLSAPKNESIQETWSWPLRIDGYDKSPHLTQVEYATLENLFSRTEKYLYPSTKRPLQRIVQPIEDALLHIHAIPHFSRVNLLLILLEMDHLATTFSACPV